MTKSSELEISRRMSLYTEGTFSFFLLKYKEPLFLYFAKLCNILNVYYSILVFFENLKSENNFVWIIKIIM